jgi:probable rRNA maturation factor
MKPKLALSVQYAAKPADVPNRARMRRWVQAALQKPAELTLRVVDEDEGRTLNRDYRGKDYATNVLTFVYDDDPVVAGDIVLCAPVVSREAREQGKTPEAHYAHLVVHGVLHLQGYDHENDADAQTMEAREAEILRKLGYDDPYKIA